MDAIFYLINFLFDFYLILVIVRVWLQAIKADFYNPVSQFSFKATQPFVLLLSRFLPRSNFIDFSCIFLALIASSMKWSLFFFSGSSNIDFLNLFILSVFTCIKEFGQILFWCIILRSILSWFNQGYKSYGSLIIDQMTDPFLLPIRRFMPDLGGIDLSPMLLIFLLNFLNKLILSFNFTVLGSIPINRIWGLS